MRIRRRSAYSLENASRGRNRTRGCQFELENHDRESFLQLDFWPSGPSCMRDTIRTEGVRIGEFLWKVGAKHSILRKYFKLSQAGKEAGSKGGERLTRWNGERQVLEGTVVRAAWPAISFAFSRPQNDWSRLASVMRFLPSQPLARKLII